jgi:hypothetical protein
MFSRASVDQRLTGTDSSMKVSRFSESDPLCRFSGIGGWGTDPDRLKTRFRRLPNGLKGRTTAEGEIKSLEFSHHFPSGAMISARKKTGWLEANPF